MKRGILILLSVLLSFAFAPLESWIVEGASSAVSAAPVQKKAAQKKAAQKKAAQKKAAQKKAAQKKAAQKKAAQKKAAQKKTAQKNVASKKTTIAQKSSASKRAATPQKPVLTPAQEAAAYQARVAEVEAHNKRVAAYQTRDIAHRLGLWGGVGYSAIFPSNFVSDALAPNAVGGVGGGVGLGYQLRYKKFLLTTGVEFQSYNSLTRLTAPIQSFGVQEYATMQYHYLFTDMQDQWNTGYVQIPLLVGMELPQWYWQVGAKVGMNVYTTSAIQTSLTTSITDQELIDDLVNMQNHQLATSTYEMQDPIALQLNPNVALAAEVGMSLDKWLRPTVKRGRRMSPMQKFATSLHYQLALFAEYGLMNIYNSALAEGHTNAIPADFSSVLGKSVDTPLAYTSSLQTSSAAKASLNPFLVGVKLAVMYELPRQDKKMLPIPLEPKPRLVTKVTNAETGLALGSAQVTIENIQTGAVVNSTSNSKGVVMARFSKADYRISASKLGYLPCDTITWSHMADLSDTVRFALVPEPKPIVYTLCGYVLDKANAQPLEAELRVVGAQDQTPLYNGATNEEGLFVSNLLAGTYTIYANSIGYLPLDTMVQFDKDTLYLPLEPIKEGIKVKINHLYFATNKTVILPESEDALNDLAKFLRENPTVSIRIIGHTDNVGSDADNMRLSMGRSKAVRTDLVMRGIDASRIEAIGMGETAPIATNDTEEGRAQNRRVEFEITDTQGSDIQQIYE